MSEQPKAARRVAVVAFDGCPHASLALDRLSQAVEQAEPGSPAPELVVVQSSQQGRRAGLHGSPTILVDGQDAFPAPDMPAWTCRLYPTEEGLQGAPSVAQLERLLSRPRA